MKKINLLILTILLIVPFYVKAAATPKVLTLEVSTDGNVIEYKGTTEEDVHAVMCKLYNADKEEVDLLSSAVDSKEFTGSFSVKEKGDYKVACANYDGGEIKEAKVTFSENSKDKNNPETYDQGITIYIILIAVAVIGIVWLIVYKNKKKKM